MSHDAQGTGWYKSSYTANAGNCVEVRELPDGGRAVRDSKKLDIAYVVVPREAWHQFVSALSDGRVL